MTFEFAGNGEWGGSFFTKNTPFLSASKNRRSWH